ncbi:hypothetical protein [Acrocarpospora sp. B8E8]|uniref:hypothetical protein n=1 Tax=Acrocarpospora sp. B8E8 TaxID=3153572 RepID=UPI00325E489A
MSTFSGEGRTEQVWAWDVDVPLAWLLVDEYTGDVNGSDILMALCAEIDGLFADLEPPPAPEHYTLIGCEPTGPLRAALQEVGTDQAWLACILLDPLHDPHQPPPKGCQRYQ